VTASGKLSFWEKVGYSLGDGAANFVFMLMILFQLSFYTDTLGIGAGIAGTLLLVARFWDAFFDPFMGTVADRTNTRWGKFRPWVLWTALPWGIVMVLAYTVPDFDTTGKIVWALLTNILLMTLYSANNTPYSAMTAVMTGDVNERTSLSSFRFVAATIAQLVVGGFTLPLVAKLGHGNAAHGWQLTMGLWAIVCMVAFVITFLSTKERIAPIKGQKMSVKEDFGNLLKNGPWIAMFILTLAHFTVLALRGGTVFYFFQYYVSKDHLFDFLQQWGLTGGAAGQGGFWPWLLDTFGLVVDAQRSNVSSVGFSLLNITSQVVTIIGVAFSTALSIKFGKKAVALAGFSITTIFMAAFILLPPDAIWAIFINDWLRALSYAPTIPLIWAIFADVVDYSEWKFQRRPTGIIYATILFGLKTGLSLGGFLAGWLLAWYGYQANAVQNAEALMGIRLAISVYPALVFCVVIACLMSYRISKQLNLQIQDELAERRARAATSNA
jgi:glycoside/pentoside/hexuronide:cation symporter, GPH family